MNELKQITLKYTQNGSSFCLMTDGSAAQTGSVCFSADWDGGRLSVQVSASAEIVLEELSAVFAYAFDEEERIFLNGWQSWTDSVEHGIRGKMRGLDHLPRNILEKYALTQYGDYNFTAYPNQAGRLHGWTYGYLRRGEQFVLIGSLNEQDGFMRIETDTEAGTVSLFKDCEGLHLQGDYGMQAVILSGSEQAVFDGYFAALGLPPVKSEPIFGYTSWYRHYANISEQKIIDDLLGLHSLDYRADVFQVDDGWATAVGDWFSVDKEKFPNGMDNIADDIRKAKQRPGLWLAPFVCEEKSEIFREHKDWIVTDRQGEFVRGGSNWSGFYALDIYHPEVRAYLRQVFDTVIHAWGYALLKLDFLYAACIEPRPDKTRGMIMADAMDFLRSVTKDAQILGCGVPLGSAFGKVDYCRIGCDVSLDWDDKPYMRVMHRERISTKNSLLNSVFRRQLDGRAFGNDPDVFFLRRGIGMPAAQKQCLAEINALTGSVLFTSDDCAEYNDNQQMMLRQLMRLRDAEVLSAEVQDGQLTIRFRRGGKEYTKQYPL
ncbi:MAG: alpha-galactosidase [Oscillospiraceae bacterium]|nr:alpha-galactosidase [Oscillospiraceae bacterium]